MLEGGKLRTSTTWCLWKHKGLTNSIRLLYCMILLWINAKFNVAQQYIKRVTTLQKLYESWWLFTDDSSSTRLYNVNFRMSELLQRTHTFQQMTLNNVCSVCEGKQKTIELCTRVCKFVTQKSETIRCGIEKWKKKFSFSNSEGKKLMKAKILLTDYPARHWDDGITQCFGKRLLI